MGIGDDKGDAGEAAGDEAPQEGRPARSVLGAEDVDAEDLPVAVRVHAGGDDGRHADRPGLPRGPCGTGRRARRRCRGPASRGRLRNSATLASRFLASSETWDLDMPSMPMELHEVVDPSGGDAFDVGLADHRDEGLLGTPAGLEERGQVAALAQLWDVEADRAGPGVPAPFAVAVAAVHAIVGPLAVAGVAEHVDVGVHEQLSCHLHHLSEQVASSIGLQVLAQQLGRAHGVVDVHRIFSFVFFGRNLKVDAVVVASGGPSGRATPRTPLWRTQLVHTAFTAPMSKG